MVTYYNILGVEENANLDEIKKAFRQKVFDCHPDINGNSEENKRRFIAIRNAYHILSDQARKQQYDDYLTKHRTDLLRKKTVQQYAERRMREERQRKEVEEDKERRARFGGMTALVILGFVVLIGAFLTVIYGGSSDITPSANKKDKPWPTVKKVTEDESYKINPPAVLSTETEKAMIEEATEAAVKLRLENSQHGTRSKEKRVEDTGVGNTAASKSANNKGSINTRSLSTGDRPYISTYGGGVYDNDSQSYIDVKNGVNSDAIVMFYDVKKNKVCRHAYIRKGASYRVSNIPQGLFDMRVYYGNGWDSDKYNGGSFPAGGFEYDESFQQSGESDYFIIKFTTELNGYSYPCYEVTLYQVRNGNMSTESISKDGFFS